MEERTRQFVFVKLPVGWNILYFSDLVFSAITERLRNVWKVACSEHAIAVKMSFLASCRYGNSTGSVTDYRLHYTRIGVLSPINL